MTKQPCSLYIRKLIAILPICAMVGGTAIAAEPTDGLDTPFGAMDVPFGDGMDRPFEDDMDRPFEDDMDRPDAPEDETELWGYDVDSPRGGPEEWGMIDGNETCEYGTQQSPIDLKHSAVAPRNQRVRARRMRDVKFKYSEMPLYAVNTNYTIQVDYSQGGAISLRRNGPDYSAVYYNFHAPSEHKTEKGAYYDMEMHIVHENVRDPSKLAVVALFIREGKENSVLQTLWDHMPNLMEADSYAKDARRINIEEVLPEDRRYVTYKGSLTTPPCTEEVKWIILKEPIEMSRKQIDEFKAVLQNSCCAINGNNRPIQDLNGRRVRLDYRHDYRRWSRFYR